MRKHFTMFALVTLFLTQATFANMGNNSYKNCDTIADACKSAGYTNEGMGDKSFWFGCMKPVLFNKTVSGVNVSAKVVKACRKDKIEQMKKELKELQSVK